MLFFFRIDLDHDHYGLEKLKKRVIEYLAVRKLKNSLKGKSYIYSDHFITLQWNQKEVN